MSPHIYSVLILMNLWYGVKLFALSPGNCDDGTEGEI